MLGLKKKESVDQYLQELHWLKVQQRIEYKILLLTFKSLNSKAPEYLTELVQYNNMSGSRLPSLKTSGLNSYTSCRAFSSVAPSLWNTLPSTIRQEADINMFKKLLKNIYFKNVILYN